MSRRSDPPPGRPEGGVGMAMERREVDRRCGWSWTSLLSRSKALLDGKPIDITLQIGLHHASPPEVVKLATELVRDAQ